MGRKPEEYETNPYHHGRWATYGIQLGLIAASIAMGAAFGFIAAVGMGAVSMSPAGAMMGAVVGFVVSPFLLIALHDRPIVDGLLVIFVPNVFVSFVCGVISQTNPVALLGSVIFFAFWCLVARGMVDPMSRYPSRCCQRCGYNLAGLTDLQPCPECGAKRTAQDSDSDQSTGSNIDQAATNRTG